MAGEEALDAADGFAFGLAFGDAPGDVGVGAALQIRTGRTGACRLTLTLPRRLSPSRGRLPPVVRRWSTMTASTARSIPAQIKHSVRQRCGFGCVICGSPIYEYDHMLGFAEVDRHVASKSHCCASHITPK